MSVLLYKKDIFFGQDLNPTKIRGHSRSTFSSYITATLIGIEIETKIWYNNKKGGDTNEF